MQFLKHFEKDFGKIILNIKSKYRGNSRIDLRNVWWKFQENFIEFLDILEGNLGKKEFVEILKNIRLIFE